METLEEALGALVDLIDVDDAAEWLRARNPDLKHESPLDLIAAGRSDRVIKAIEKLVEEG
jgi:hypothetical protein